MLTTVFLLAALVVSAIAQCAPGGFLNLTVPVQGSVSIQSPNYPDNYPGSSNCQWTITGSNTARPGLEVNSDDFCLEGTTTMYDCSYDYVTIIQVNAGGSETELGKFCGNDGPQKLVSTTNSIKIIFRTDGYFSYRGFKFTISEPICAYGTSLCPGSATKCIKPSQWCDGEGHCPGNTDEGPSCSRECGITSIPPKGDMNTMRFLSLVTGRAKRVDNRISNGVEAEPHSLPWQIAMLDQKGSQICGGSIINDQWVMTTGHCCQSDGPFPANYKVRVGVHMWNATNEPYAKTYSLEKVVVHPDYQRLSLHSSNYCLLKINGTIEFRPHVGAICLAGENDCLTGSAAMVSGWGETKAVRMGDQKYDFGELINHSKNVQKGLLVKEDMNSYNTPALHQAYVDVITQDKCKAIYGADITSDMMCAYRAGKDSCQNDQGGPLVQRGSEGVWKLCGVTSFGRGCYLANYAGVYARISTAVEWTMSTIMSN